MIIEKIQDEGVILEDLTIEEVEQLVVTGILILN
jgi:hypothetical protein